MAFGDSSRYQSKTAMSEINVVPLVDVMLVLLIIFMITAPLLTHSVKVDLPKASSSPNLTQPEHIEFAIRARWHVFTGGENLLRWTSYLHVLPRQLNNPSKLSYIFVLIATHTMNS